MDKHNSETPNKGSETLLLSAHHLKAVKQVHRSTSEGSWLFKKTTAFKFCFDDLPATTL